MRHRACAHVLVKDVRWDSGSKLELKGCWAEGASKRSGVLGETRSHRALRRRRSCLSRRRSHPPAVELPPPSRQDGGSRGPTAARAAVALRLRRAATAGGSARRGRRSPKRRWDGLPEGRWTLGWPAARNRAFDLAYIYALWRSLAGPRGRAAARRRLRRARRGAGAYHATLLPARAAARRRLRRARRGAGAYHATLLPARPPHRRFRAQRTSRLRSAGADIF